MILPLVLLRCFIVGRQNKGTIAEPEVMKTQEEVEEQNKEIVRRYAVEEDNGNLLEIIDEIVSPDIVYHYPNNNTITGLESLKRKSPQLHKAFPDLKHTIEFQIAEGDMVATRYTRRGTHKGEWSGISPKNKEVIFTFLDVCRINDGKIVEAWIELDYLGLMQQLGMELKPK